jgi:predicted DNA-binding transcriptional regulator AlpA
MEKELDPILSEEQVKDYDNGLTKSQRNKLIKRGLYPNPVRTMPNGRKRGWFKSDILAYQARLRAESAKPYTGMNRDKRGRMAA